MAHGFVPTVAATAARTSIQWWTLAWIVGAGIAATLIIATIVIFSRRPKSMEDGMEEFSRSLQAVAPVHRSSAKIIGGDVRQAMATPYEERGMHTGAHKGVSEDV